MAAQFFQLEEFRRKTARAGTAQAVITPEQIAQLQSLGYVTSPSGQPEAEEKQRGPDPKERVEISNLLHQALLEADEEHYRDAIPRLEQVLKAQPNIALANLQLGRAWNGLGEYSKALPWLQKAVQLTPQSVWRRRWEEWQIGKDRRNNWKLRWLKTRIRMSCGFI